MASDEYYFKEGCFITELHNTPEDPEASVARARVEPGRVTRWHSLAAIRERYLILQGSGLAEIDDEPPRPVAPATSCRFRRLPPARRQHRRDGSRLPCVCTPRFVAAAYQDLETATPKPV